MSASKTPVMQQHAQAKRAYPDAIVFFRLGDFYEMFGEDAVVGARLLDLTLTSRNKGKPDEIPMAGVPHHSAHGYIARLLELGHKVALCEQMADPATVKGIVPRQVVRVITPGLITDNEQLDAARNNFLCALDLDRQGVGIALFDLSTGELRAAVAPDLTRLLGELSRAAPREVLVGGSPEWTDDLDAALRSIERAARGAAVRSDGPLAAADLPAELGPLAEDARHLPAAATRATARALRFARVCNPGTELPLRRIGTWNPSAALVLDATAVAHLELVESAAGAKQATLLGVIDQTCTAAGARLLRRRLLGPLADVERIRRRLDAVELFVVHARLRGELRRALDDVTDLERLAMRASLGEATPRDLGALRDGLTAAGRALALLSAIPDPSDRETLGLGGEPVDAVTDLAEELGRALVERPPAQLKEGSIFRPGFALDLDELDLLRKSGAERMVALESELRERTGISTLKIRYTRVFGWYIEVSRGQAAKVPEEFRRKQTVASGERYTTPALDDLADKITTAEERHRERELDLYRELALACKAATDRVLGLSRRIARWDVAAALAEVAHRYDYTRPEVDDSLGLEIEDGRHPVVERLAAAGRFVPNDVRLDAERERLWLITGPNMAGKSTLLRQIALITILAQLGSYVPARRARIGLVDRILSRVGASDNLAGGESTFMVEMRETATILRHATRRSLVILDEIGRGTSTFDGLAIAWAVAEHIDEVVGCRSLFATHYHELTELGETSQHVANHSVSARELDGDVVFLHRLVKGPASQSYGVAVAKLAGLPESVLARARALLATLEGQRSDGKPRPPPSDQLDLFGPRPQASALHGELIATIRAVDIDRVTPLDALQLLAKLKHRLSNG